MAGYSRRILKDKLGIKNYDRILVLNAPENFFDLIKPFPEEQADKSFSSTSYPVVIFFAEKFSDLETEFGSLKKALHLDGMLWICWPKKAAKTGSDLDDNKIRELGLQGGLVDVKVCAVDKKWSGLKLVYRLIDRRR